MERWHHVTAGMCGLALSLASPTVAGADDNPSVESAPDSATEQGEGGGATPEVTKSNQEATASYKLSGYVLPGLSLRYRPDARPRDELEYGASTTETGIVIEGEPVVGWSYYAELIFGADVIESVSGVDLVDTNADDVPDRIDTDSELLPGLFIERATVDLAATEWLDVSFGQMRIPFTAQAQSSNTSLLFPERSAPTQVFLSGTDLGLLATVRIGGDMAKVSAGAFNGTGGTPQAQSSERGLLYAARVDVHPLGSFPFGTTDVKRGPFRIGVGAGVLYFPSTRFDSSGFEGQRARDLRASLSVRAAVRGLFVQGEVLRRQETDDLSERPVIATGAYGQASYYLALAKLGVAPIARIGFATEDQSFDPRTTFWMRFGLSLYLRPHGARPDQLKVTAAYVQERRLTEGETAHGASARLQLLW